MGTRDIARDQDYCVEKTFETIKSQTHLTLWGPTPKVDREVEKYLREFPFTRFDTKVTQRTTFPGQWVAVNIVRNGYGHYGHGNRYFR